MEEKPQYLIDAEEMSGSGYEHPSIEIRPPTTVIRRRGKQLFEESVPSQVSISASFKDELKDIDGTDLKVWLFIALSLNKTTEEAFPGIRTIASKCGIGENTAMRSVKRLEESGLMTVNRANRRVNIYTIPQYAFANLKTASIVDTDETASEIDETASENAQTASENVKTASTCGGVTINQLTNKPQLSKSFVLMQAKSLDWLLAHADEIDEETYKEIEAIIVSEQKRVDMEARIKKYFGVNAEYSKKGWDKVIDKLIEHEGNGQSLEKYRTWCREHPYDAPKTTQISMKPEVLLDTWPAAFMDDDTGYNPQGLEVNR